MYTDILPSYKHYHQTLHWDHSVVHLTTENDIYPARIHIDFKKIIRGNKFTLYDLSLILPRGLQINKKKHKNIYDKICYVKSIAEIIVR